MVTHLVVAPLWGHHDAADLLDLWVVWGAHSVHEARDLGAQVGDADELLQQVLGHHKPVNGIRVWCVCVCVYKSVCACVCVCVCVSKPTSSSAATEPPHVGHQRVCR